MDLQTSNGSRLTVNWFLSEIDPKNLKIGQMVPKLHMVVILKSFRAIFVTKTQLLQKWFFFTFYNISASIVEV